MIGALNNKKDFDNSRRELEKILPDCKQPAEIARFFYMNGYIMFMNDKELMALNFYEAGVAADPDDTSGLDLPAEAKECEEYVENDLKELRKVAKKLAGEINKRCAENPEKRKMSDGEFTVQMGLIPSVRRIPVTGNILGVNDFFVQYEGNEKAAVGQWLERAFGIKDMESFLNFYRDAGSVNIQRMYADVKAHFMGDPNIAGKLSGNALQSFSNACRFIKRIYFFAPESGVIAWDISERVGYSRLAYACGILSQNDYVASMAALKEAALKNFNSSAEYLKSLIFGGALYTFASEEWSIKRAIAVMEHVSSLALKGGLPDAEWK